MVSGDLTSSFSAVVPSVCAHLFTVPSTAPEIMWVDGPHATVHMESECASFLVAQRRYMSRVFTVEFCWACNKGVFNAGIFFGKVRGLMSLGLEAWLGAQSSPAA